MKKILQELKYSLFGKNRSFVERFGAFSFILIIISLLLFIVIIKVEIILITLVITFIFMMGVNWWVIYSE